MLDCNTQIQQLITLYFPETGKPYITTSCSLHRLVLINWNTARFQASAASVFALLDQGSSSPSPLKMEPTCSPETSVHNYQHRPRQAKTCTKPPVTITYVLTKRTFQPCVRCNNSYNSNRKQQRLRWSSG
jgi:hypothetical protein